MLRAIRRGDADALVVESATGPQVYAMQGLDAATNRFRGEILAQVSDAVIATDSDQRITYVNAAAERLYGFTASGMLGRELSDFYVARWLRPGAEDGRAAALRERGEWRGEYIHVRHDGRELDVEFECHGAAGDRRTVSRAAAVIRDVTERKRSEEKVLVSEVRYRRLFEAAHDGVFSSTP